MKHGSLFSGIGGFELAAEWAGWENIFHCEWNEFGKRVLNYYWPDSISYDDITKTDFTIYRGNIDILTGGFPCQPYSQAGKRLGKADNRHLWPQMLRAIQEIQPTWVVGENVSGLINWNGGLVFDEVQADLEAQGYEVQAYVLPAVSVNAPHRRDRVWFVAYNECSRLERQNGEGMEYSEQFTKYTTPCTDSNGHKLRGFGKNRSTQSQGISQQEQRERIWTDDRGISKQGNVTNACNERCKRLQFGQTPEQGNSRKQTLGSATKFYKSNDWSDFPTQPPVRSRNDGISSRLAGITVPKHRNESIKAYGNAIVPQVAYQIFKAINQYDH